ncbi:MAG: hypothetical protein LUD72_05295 [Bacteroidales bacterium]|nr:hypothetical protein [Bacteroidales bacterium]
MQTNRRHISESPDHVLGVVGGKSIESSFHDYESKAFVYDIQAKKFYVGSERSQHAHLFDWIVDEVMDDNPDWYVEDAEDYAKALLARNSDTGINGRVWFDNKVISFWNMPSIKVLRDMVNDCDFNLEDFYVDEGNGEEMKTVRQILRNAEIPETHFDLKTIHNMDAKEKHDTPQLKGARKTANKVKAQKLGNSPEVKYNFYRNYGIGDSINRTSTGQVNEVEADDVSLNSFRVKDELNPKFWVNDKLNSKVRQRLLDIAGDFMDETAIKWVKPEDIVFTGSMANYNWSRYSDVDVHIMVDYKKVYPKDPDFVEDYFDAKKELWADTHGGLKIYGYPVEVYVEDTNKKNTSTGIYSLNKNKWIVEPGDFEDATINASYVKKEAAKIMTEIDNITKRAENTNDDRKLDKCSEDLKKIFDKLKKIRKDGLKKGGEMSSGNIIWKICRRMGYLDKLWDSVNKSYDKINSIR